MKTPTYPAQITVRNRSDAHRARCGTGKASATASCTSDDCTAAYRAAAKYFGVKADRLVCRCLSSDRDGSRWSARPLVTGETLTVIEFEDHGQDFNRWMLSSDGVVIECAPFQAWVWCQCTVHNLRLLEVGGPVLVTGPHYDSITPIKYPVAAITRKEAA